MSTRELIALGTASQVPTRKRNHQGCFVRWDDTGVLFDPGEGTQRQMLHYGVPATAIHLVLITHLHGDHCLGLAGVVQRLSLDRVPHTVRLAFPATGQRYVDHLRDASIYRDEARIEELPINAPGVVWRAARFEVRTARLDHSVDSWGYRLQAPDGFALAPERLAALGLSGPPVGRLKREGSIAHGGRRISVEEVGTRMPGASLAFVMDTRPCEGALALARGADVLVCESTYLSSEAREAHDHGHMTARQAGELARDAGAGLLVLTHFSQRYPDTRAFVEEARAVHPRVVALDDGDRVDLRLAARRPGE